MIVSTFVSEPRCVHCGELKSRWHYQLCENGKGHQVDQLVPQSIKAPEQKVTMEPETIEQILAERGSRYGSWMDNSYYARAMLDVVDRAKEDREKTGRKKLTPYQENSINMIIQKLSRILSGDASYEDNWVDIAGYAELGRNPR